MSSKNRPDPRRSLLGRLMLGFVGVMLGIWLTILVWDVYEAKTYRDDTLQDTKNLVRQLLILMPLAKENGDGDIAAIASQFQKARERGFQERAWYTPQLQIQIWRRGRLIYTSDNGLPEAVPSAAAWHGAPDAKWATWVESDERAEATVKATQEVTGRWVFTIGTVGYYLLPLFYSLPFLLIPAWFIIKAGLNPLRTIVGEIEARSSSDPMPAGPSRKDWTPLKPLPPSPYKELSPLVTSVNRLMKRLSERVDREQEFLLNAAHEMKIPLAIIQLNAEGLVDNSDFASLQEARDGLQQGVARATHTVHQLLALARSGVDSDHAERQSIDLIELVQDRLALAAQIAMQRGIEIELQGPRECMMPLHRETAVLLIDNLIGNAVKYSPDQGHIAVGIEPGERNVLLSVCDQGPGIPPELRRKVFERFFRLSGQEQPGSGLGLSIAERAAARNNAHIRLEDGCEGQGLTAIVEFCRETTGSERQSVAGQ